MTLVSKMKEASCSYRGICFMILDTILSKVQIICKKGYELFGGVLTKDQHPSLGDTNNKLSSLGGVENI